MGIEMKKMADLEVLELPEGFDPLEMQRELQEMIREKLPQELRAKVTSQRRETYRGVLEVVRPQIENVQMELAEILESMPWKYWKHTHVAVLDEEMADNERIEIAYEIVDILHFLINMAVAIGVDWPTLMKLFHAKQIENRRRQTDGY